MLDLMASSSELADRKHAASLSPSHRVAAKLRGKNAKSCFLVCLFWLSLQYLVKNIVIFDFVGAGGE